MKLIKSLIIVTVCTAALVSQVKAQEKMTSTIPLNKKELSIVPIAALTAKGDMPKLQAALQEGLDAGLTINETKEILTQLYAYAGFPRSLNALHMLMTVLEDRKKKGITDEQGKEASPIPTGKTKLQAGTENQTRLVGQPVKGAIYEFAPVIDRFLKEHLFADIFGRDILDYKTREITTISALAGLGGAENQLRSHINVGIHTGLTATQLDAIVSALQLKVGITESQSMKIIVQDILKSSMKNGPATGRLQNPFTLVYDGAITENVKGQVNIRPVTYKIRDINIAANIYTPPNYEPGGHYPAIVVAHPNGGVKEQVAGLYAQELAKQGYITITADAAYQGGSGGVPRNTDKPANRIEDIYAMGDFISRFDGVDTARLGLLGICGGGGYSLKAAQSDKRFKAVATLSMFNTGLVRRNGFMNSQLSTIQERLQQASNARAQEAAGGEVRYANNSTTALTDEQVAKLPFELYRQGYEYYSKTYAHPNSSGNYTLSSLMDLMNFDASSNMDLINQPLLMMAGSKADSYYMTEEAFGKAVNARNKELFLIEGATHIETYWKPEYVTAALKKLNGFFGNNLK